MQEVQRFNKVLKSLVLSGDIILLNLLLWVFGSLLGNRSPLWINSANRLPLSDILFISNRYQPYTTIQSRRDG